MSASFNWSGGSSRFPDVPFRRLFAPVKRVASPTAEIVTAYTNGQVTLRSNRTKVGYHEASDLFGFLGVEPGDFVVHGLDILRGSVGVSDSSGAISAVCTVCLPIAAIEPRFMAYAMRAQAWAGVPRALARGVREGGADFRRWDTLGELPLPCPPVEQQRRIADFLDEQVGVLDRAVALRLRQTELVSERHLSLLQNLATGACEQNKVSSGVDWVAQTPPDWKRRPLKQFFTFSKGRDAQRLTQEFVQAHPGRYPVYSGATQDDVSFGQIDTYDFDVSDEAILISTVGARAMTARLVSGKFSLSQNCALLVRRSTDDARSAETRFIFHQLVVALRLKRSEIPDHMQPSLRIEDLRRYWMILPPVDTQQHTAMEIDKSVAATRSLQKQMKTLVQLLTERRQSLITAAVTGQFDVTTARAVAE
jgi:type I restriction enzyme, S subunit